MASIPWSALLGDGELPVVGPSDRDGEGLVVLIGKLGDLAVVVPTEIATVEPA